MLRWLLIPALMLAFTGFAAAQKTGPARQVQDDAGLFSAAAKEKANGRIAEIHRKFGKDLLIETVSTAPRPPAGLDVDDKKAVDRFFDGWAQERFSNERVNG